MAPGPRRHAVTAAHDPIAEGAKATAKAAAIASVLAAYKDKAAEGCVKTRMCWYV